MKKPVKFLFGVARKLFVLPTSANELVPYTGACVCV